MSILKNINTIYFIGIGGIGMSALARFAKVKGLDVFGYDKTETALTKKLISEGITVGYEDEISALPKNISHKKNVLVVYTPAIPKDNVIFNWFQSEGYDMMKRAKLLGEITKDTLCLAVAGTHGKTTTSAILGHLLAECNMPVTAFLGGIAENYKSNFISRGTKITVVEADEFDRSFLTLSPDIACVTSMDADHLDIYGSATEIEKSFNDFAALLSNEDHLLYRKGLPLKGQSVAIEETAAFEAQNVRIKDGAYRFDFKTPDQILKNLQFLLPGHHNLHNAITALGMALLAGAPTSELPRALSGFKGVERRFSYKIKCDNLVLIDDYAHHPTEINALFQAVAEMYPGDEKLIVFQPHLFSRTKDFVDGFAESLAQFDQILLLDIYPAREKPIEGVSSGWLLTKIHTVLKDSKMQDNQRNKEIAKIVTKTELVKEIKKSKCRIKLLVGAGDIGAEVENITKILNNES
ncbi:UDP-N-acetylmuramate--L-alanine ligase [Patiriisocius marinistellae]|uniref:UDP-N-acetylmuramate--L-alanine ligase n=1 Tax=Patiriisocius marinistellae TaxID=2494560 RepID=A0A5J4G2U7_9FLAO|nr:cyanophycin synthetase [Patiriisocius marinistellae]GEQ86965.1 UDP-N-acetylmuramate--L-alanine ligase [Patiriisocius marinistellae]